MSGHRVTSVRKRQTRKSKYPPHDAKLAYRLLVDLYKHIGLNTAGKTPKQGWKNGGAGLTPLNVNPNPILDPYYEAPETPGRLTVREMRELL